jgi:hypothetical protein
MADRYWVGGNGTWNESSTTNWSATSGGPAGASAPTAADDVIINAASSSPTITLVNSLACKSLTTTGATCALAGTSASLNISGNLTLSATTTWVTTIFVTINAASTITTNGVTINSPILFNSDGNTLTLGSALTLNTARTFTFTAGTLNLNNFTLSAGAFSSSNTNTRVIQFGTGNITTTSSGTAVNINGTNFSYTGTPTVNLSFTGSTATNLTLSTGFTETNALNVNITSGTYAFTGTNAVFRNLNTTGYAGTFGNQSRTIYGNLTFPASGGSFQAGNNVTTFAATSGTQIIFTNNRALDFPFTQNGVGGTVQLLGSLTSGITRTYTFTAGTLDLNNYRLSTGIFSSNNTNTRAILFGFGGGSNITTTSSGNNLNINATNFTYSGTPTVNVSANTGTATSVTLITGFTQANALNVNYTTGTYTLTDNSAVYRNLNFTGFGGNVGNSNRIIYGDFVIPATGGTYATGTNPQLFLGGNTTQNIVTNGRTLEFPITLGNFSSFTSFFIINGALTLSGANGILTHNAGALVIQSSTTTSVTNFVSAGPVTREIRSSNPGTRATLAIPGGTTVTMFSTRLNSIIFSGGTFNSYGTLGGSSNNVGNINLFGGYGGALYWVGGNGTWSTTGNTNFSFSSGGAATALTPDASTPVIVDNNSGSPTITLSGTQAAGGLITTNGTTCTFTGSSGLVLSAGMTLSATTTWATSNQITFNNSATITTNGVRITNGVVFGTSLSTGGYTYTLGSALTATSNTVYNADRLNLNGFTLSVGTFNSNVNVVRQIQFGTGNITVTGFIGGTILSIAGTNFTYTGTPTVNVSYSGSLSTTVTLSSGFTETNALSVNYTTGTYSLTENSNNTYRNLNFTGFTGTVPNTTRTVFGNFTIPAVDGAYTAGNNVTTFAATSGTQVITTNGRGLDFPFTQNGIGGTVQLADSLTLGSPRAFTFTNGTLNLNNFTLLAGSFASNTTSVRAIQFGTGNITTTGSGTAVNIIGTNLTYTGTPTVNVSNNNATATTVTLNTGFTETNALSVNYTTGTYTLSNANIVCRNLNYTGFDGSTNHSSRTIYGNLTLPASGGLFGSGTFETTFAATSGTQVITSNGRTIGFPITQNGPGGTLQLADDLTLVSNLFFTITAGTFDAVTFNVTAGYFVSSNTNTRTINMGSGLWTIAGAGTAVWLLSPTTGLTFNKGTANILLSSTNSLSREFVGGSLTYNKLTIGSGATSTLVMAGSNTFSELASNKTVAHTIEFTPGTTTTVTDFTITGTAGNVVTLQDFTPGGTWSLVKVGGGVVEDIDYLNIRNSAASPGLTWYAGANSIDSGGNTGWIFSAFGASNSNFFLLF